MKRLLGLAGIALLAAPGVAGAGDGHDCTEIDNHSDHDVCECSIEVEWYRPGPPPAPVRVRPAAYRVTSRPVNIPGPVVYIQGPPVYVDAPPVRVAPAQIYVERPEVIVRPSQVIVEPPQVHMQSCRDGERCRPASAPAPRSDGY